MNDSHFMTIGLVSIAITVILLSFLVFTLWVQPGESRHHLANMSVSHCKGNQTGLQFTEGNVSGNPQLTCK
jgi:hypothetical protein